MKKRILSLALAVVLVFAFVPAVVAAIIAPTCSTNTATNITSSSATLSGTQLTNGGATVWQYGFDLNKDGVFYKTYISTSSFSVTATELPPGSYVFRAWLKNKGADNISDTADDLKGYAANTASFTIAATKNPKVTSVTISPPSGIVNTTSFTITAYANSDTNKVALYIDNVLRGYKTGASPFVCDPRTFNTQGTKRIDMYPVDTSGNELRNAGAYTTVTVSQVAAIIAPTCSTNTATNITSSSATLSGTKLTDGGATVWQYGFDLNKDDVFYKTYISTSSFSVTATELPAGSYVFRAWLKNKGADNISDTADDLKGYAANTASFTIAATKNPTVTNVTVDPPSGIMNTTSFTITAYANSDTNKVALYIDDVLQGYKTGSSPFVCDPRTFNTQGTKRIDVYPVDVSGNELRNAGAYTTVTVTSNVSDDQYHVLNGKQDKHTYDANGVCSICGYVCKHSKHDNDTYVSSESRQLSGNSEYHEIRHWYMHSCIYCETELPNVASSWETQKHTFVNGQCSECLYLLSGYKPAEISDYIIENANRLGVDALLLQAIIQAESSGQPFINGKLIIRFENHIFLSRDTTGVGKDYFRANSMKSHQFRTTIDGSWRNTHTGKQQDEWDALSVALNINKEIAYQSISMGMGQVMGFNYSMLGYSSAEAMFNDFCKGEKEQIIGMIKYIELANMITAIKNKNFREIARIYNGSGNVDVYSVKIEGYYNTLIALYGNSPMNTDPLNSASSWARDGITAAIGKGFIPTDLQNNYQSVITRAEFCRMAIKWMEYKTGKNIDTILSEKSLSRRQDAFSDTTDPDILAAYALGITSGEVAPTATTPGKFNPSGQFNREQAATMIRNVWKAIGLDISNIQDAGFTDINTASDWAREAINFCNNNGIMNGTSTSPKLFSPKDTYTREQSIVTFNNMP